MNLMETGFEDRDVWNWLRVMPYARLWNLWCWNCGFCCQGHLATGTFLCSENLYLFLSPADIYLSQYSVEWKVAPTW